MLGMSNGNEPNIITSADAARMLGMSTGALTMYLSRYPDLRPARRISGDDLLWTPGEVERVSERRASKRAAMRAPRKRKNE
jgi:hypothetical protein